MTNTEADALIASLPKPGSLRLHREGDEIIMDGGKFGGHSIRASVSSGERLLVHWKGYVENQGLSLGPDYGRTEAPRSAPQMGAALAELQPGEKIAFSSPSYSGKNAHGYRPGVVVRVTPKRVLVEYSFKYDIEEARRNKDGSGEPPRRHQIWKKRSEVRRR